MHDWVLITQWVNAHQERWAKWTCANCGNSHSSRLEKPPDPHRKWRFSVGGPNGDITGSCGDYMAFKVMES